MAIKELFQDARPQVLFDPRASQRIDPRFKFTRAGVASYYDSDGVLRYAPANQPRVGFNYEPDANGVMQSVQGVYIEKQATNHIFPSGPAGQSWGGNSGLTATTGQIAPDGSSDAILWRQTAVNEQHRLFKQGVFTPADNTIYTFSSFVKPYGSLSAITIMLEGASATFGLTATFDLVAETATVGAGVRPNGSYVITAALDKLPSGWYKASVVAFSGTSAGASPLIRQLGPAGETAFLGNVNDGFYAWGAQFAEGYFPSYIPTTSAAVTRPADLLSIDTDIPSTGSLYIDAQALDTSVNTTLLSAANASDDKLLLQVQKPANLYGSTGLVYSVDGAFKPTLPFPVPGTTRERNLITWGANNYHYRADSARSTASSAASVPDNMIELGIGHDVTDPTKGFTGYINTVYMWPGEITPTVAEALVRGDIDVKDADVEDPVPANTLAFVFNTQGTASNGNRQITLPLRGSTNNVLVDWGDNTSSALVGAAASVNVTKTYSAAGIYSVQITSDSDGTNEALENLQFYGNNPTELFRVQKWGGTAVFRPTTMYRVFRDCTQLDFENAARTGLPDTSAITNWAEAFYNCTSLSGSFPSFDFNGATTFQYAWYNCSSMTAFPAAGNQTQNVTVFSYAWYNCSSLTGFPLINTSSATTLSNTWRGCSGLTSFPLIDTGSVTNLADTWHGCSSLTNFELINTASGTNFSQTWYGCSSLTSFPLINTSSGTNFYNTWYKCSSLTSFTITNFSSATTLEGAFAIWSSFTGTFPAITTSASLTSLWGTWRQNKMTAFNPPTNTSAVTTLRIAFQGCTGLTSFPATFDSSACTSFLQTWDSCTGLTSFPQLNTSNVTDFYRAWVGCTNLTGTFPTIDTSKGTRFLETWSGCSLTGFPALDFSEALDFGSAWDGNDYNSFPVTTFPKATNFSYAWRNVPITDFPAGAFDSTGTLVTSAFQQTFLGCALTAASIENILVSLDTNGATGVILTLSGGTNAAKSTWTAAANTAYTNLIGKSWSIGFNP